MLSMLNVRIKIIARANPRSLSFYINTSISPGTYVNIYIHHNRNLYYRVYKLIDRTTKCRLHSKWICRNRAYCFSSWTIRLSLWLEFSSKSKAWSYVIIYHHNENLLLCVYCFKMIIKTGKIKYRINNSTNSDTVVRAISHSSQIVSALDYVKIRLIGRLLLVNIRVVWLGFFSYFGGWGRCCFSCKIDKSILIWRHVRMLC